MAQNFDVPPDGGAELEALLQRSGAEFLREGDRFRLRFSSRGCTWQTVCDCRDEWVLIYGIHPIPVTRPQQALELCAQLNGQVMEGSFFLQEGRLIFRTSARLTERFEAQARIAAALEYNAAVLSHWWERLAAGAQGSLSPFESRRSFAVPLEDTI